MLAAIVSQGLGCVAEASAGAASSPSSSAVSRVMSTADGGVVLLQRTQEQSGRATHTGWWGEEPSTWAWTGLCALGLVPATSGPQFPSL